MRWGFGRAKSHANAVEVTNAMLRRFVPSCYSCEKDLSGHEWAEFASCVVRDKSDEKANWFFKVFLEERWDDLRTERSFEGLKDAAVVYAVLCDKGGQMVAIKSPFELWDDNSRLGIQQVSPSAASRIRELSKDWHAITAAEGSKGKQ